MKEKVLTNLRILDPSQKIDEIGNIIINEKGKIKSIGKKTKLSCAGGGKTKHTPSRVGARKTKHKPSCAGAEK